MESFLIEYNNKIIGVYNTFDDAETFVLSCLQNRLMTHTVKILKFRTNSCFQIESKQISLNQQLSNNQDAEHIKPVVTVQKKITDTKPVINVDPKSVETLQKISKDKIDLQHKINMLKYHKKKLDESKNVYENDIKLFELFNDSKTNDPEFIIPELFKEKYNIMHKLKEQNNLSWETFTKEYQQENFEDNYFGLNDYEESFINEKRDIIDEEFDIETDSDTEYSEE